MQRNHRQRLSWLQTGIAALLLAVPFAAAQAQPGSEAQQQYAPPPAQQEDMEVSDEMLDNFAEAVTTVQAVQQEYSAEIQSTQDTDKAQSLRQEAQQKMVDAVENTGLTVSEYNLISQRLQSDQDLAQRFERAQRQ
jgi:hypothetical protein